MMFALIAGMIGLEKMVQLNKYNHLTKSRLLLLLASKDGIIQNQKTANINKSARLAHYHKKLKKVRDDLNYFINHTYSNGTSTRGRKR